MILWRLIPLMGYTRNCLFLSCGLMLCTQITYFLDVLYTESLTHNNMFYTQKKHLILLCSKHRITYSCDVSIHRISSMRRSRSGCWPCPWIRKWSRCSPGTRGTVTKPLWLLQTPAFALNHVWSQVQVSLSIWETWNQFCPNFKLFFFFKSSPSFHCSLVQI